MRNSAILLDAGRFYLRLLSGGAVRDAIFTFL
jgi:hypothetical protein